jgi:flagellar protein FlbD
LPFKSRAGLPINQAEMIRLHKLGRVPQPFHLNPDLIITVEASPDTVVTLTTGSRLLVTETPEEVARAVRDWRAGVLDAMTRVPRRSTSLSLVRGTASDGAVPSINAEAANHEEHRP